MIGLTARVRRLLALMALALLGALALEQLELTWHFPLTRLMLLSQDRPVLIAVSVLLLAMAALGVPQAWTGWTKKTGTGPSLARTAADRFADIPTLLGAAILGAGLVVALGTKFVTLETPITHDEIMAQFDTDIIATGRLMAPIPPEWRSLSWALKPAFRLPVPGDQAWASTYLPGNAAIRALLGQVLSPALVNAVLVALALLALLAVARRLWPARRDAWLIAVGLAATSAQVLCMGMTPFAMTAHLLLNLVWLLLFLRNTVGGHAGAIAVGFCATGLHQLIFHPLFVAPFIIQMAIERRWRLAAVYAVSYAAIGVFWIVYWQLLLAAYGAAAQTASSYGASFFVQRVIDMLTSNGLSAPETMVQNVLRFAAWQNPLMLVLIIPGIAAAWRVGGVLRSLVGGIVLTLLAMLVLLPYQDHGWGYRYVHGLIGNAALLSAFGWMTLTDGVSTNQWRAAVGLAVTTTLAAVLVLLPVHAWQVRSTLEPFAKATTAIRASGAQAMVIDTITFHLSIELIRNDPYLRNRPLLFDIGLFTEPLLRELCSKMPVTVFDGVQAARYGLVPVDPKLHPDYQRLHALRVLAESDECRLLLRAR